MFKLKSLLNSEDVISITQNGTISMGRSSANNVVIKNDSISNQHCLLHVKNNQLYISDLNSTNGTYIDGNKLTPNTEYPLNINQILILGIEGVQYKVTQNYQTEYIDVNNISSEYKDKFTIGRNATNDIIINSPNVSNVHVIISKNHDDWIIEDVSRNGTYLNNFENKLIKHSKTNKLEKNEVLYLANYKLQTNRIFQLIEKSSTAKQKLDFNKDEVLLGRENSCDLTIDNPNISSEHAKITHENNAYYIIDLKSTNGTFVNFNPIKGKTKIHEGDKITLGVYTFEFSINQQENFSLVQSDFGIRIDIQNVSYIVNSIDENKKKIKKTILDDISLSVYPGEFIGLMGLSGAGKTTLLDAMSGYIKATKGSIHINGIELYQNFETIKQYIGYVPQDDIIHPDLTVYESLMYSAKLRLDLSEKEIKEQIDKVLHDLGIDEIRNSLIGSADKKGISGGQRRRVNLAVELIAKPELIFLDEPTSGLSSVDTKSVMETLKKLTDSGKTIIITIHQPSLSNYKMMDNVIILTHGQCAYYGQNYPNSIRFFNNNQNSTEIISDPDNALLGLDKGEEQGVNWKDKYQKSQVFKEYVTDRINKPNTTTSDKMTKKKKDSAFKQFFILTARYLKIKLKDRVNTGILIAQSPLIAGLLVLLFFQGGPGYSVYEASPQILLFIIIISSVWFGLNNSVREVVSEKTIFKKERFLGLKIIPYVFSKFIILSMMALLQVTILVLIVNQGVPLKMDIPILIILAYISSLSGITLGLLLSSWVKTEASALSMLPVLLLPMIVLSGGMVPIKSMPKGVYAVSYTIPIRFTLEEVIREYDNYESTSEYLHEPILDINDSSILYYPTPMNEFEDSNEMEGITLCTVKRCVESLYMKYTQADSELDADLTVNKIENYRVHSDKRVMYSLFIFFIFFPLFLSTLVLHAKYKVK